jgi:hypothetical protein
MHGPARGARRLQQGGHPRRQDHPRPSWVRNRAAEIARDAIPVPNAHTHRCRCCRISIARR